MKSCGEQDGIFCVQEISDVLFKVLVNVLRAADKPHRRHPKTMAIDCIFRRFHHFRMGRQPEVVVRTKVNHLLSGAYFDHRILR